MPLSKTKTSILIGQVFYHASASAPTGALICDGTAISRASYPELFASIGTTHGSGDGSTTFNLPNLQGIFIRGSGSQTISSISYSGTLGTKQGDQLQGHEHPVFSAGLYSSFVAGSVGAAPNLSGGVASLYTGGATTSDGANGTPRTGSETRPANIAMTPCIWALPVAL